MPCNYKLMAITQSVEDAIEAAGVGLAQDDIERIADPIARAALEAIQPRVRPLEWTETHGGTWLRAECVSGVYEVLASDPNRYENQAKYEAYHKARILSALDLPTGGE